MSSANSEHPLTGPVAAASLDPLPADPKSQRGRKWRTRRWLPAVLAVGVVAGGALGLPTAADATVDLPDRTPAEVLAMIADSQVNAFSGTVEQSSDLGLPTLPPGGTQGVAGMLELLTAPHTARVYVSEDAARMQVLDPLSERNVVWSGDTIWTYNATTNQVTRMKLPEPGKAHSDTNGGPGQSMPATPQEFAQQAIAAITPQTEVAVGRDGRVAGRTAYELILRPRSDSTLIGSVTMAVDYETGMPLAFAVAARGADRPAFQVAFSSVDFQAPDPSVFSFTPPEGATISEVAPPAGRSGTKDDESATKVEPNWIGTGWDAVAVFPAGTAALAAAGFASGAPSATSPDPADPAELGLLSQLITPVAEGLALRTSLLNVLVTSDGGLLVGSVPINRLQELAVAQPPSQQ